MNNLSERELRELLTMNDPIEPPADLAARIKAEIPDDLGQIADDLGRSPAAAPARRPALAAGRWLALAASILAMAGESFLAYRLLRQPELTPTAVTAEHRAAEDREVAGGERSAAEMTVRGGSPRVEPASPEPARQAEALGEVNPRRPAPGAAKSEPPPAAPAETRAGGRADAPATAPAVVPESGGLQGYDEQLRGLPGELEGALRKSKRFADGRAAPVAPAPPPRPAVEEQIIVSSELPVVMDASAMSTAPAIAPPSTGGTAEPNDAPYGDVFFRGYGTNPFIDTEDDALSTFGLDVDTGSYTVVRRYLRDGHLPPADAVRVEELVNYFDYGDPPPAEGDFAVHAEGAPSIFAAGERYHLVRFNLHGREIDEGDRRPAVLTFVVDVSGSMARENRLGLVKEALTLLVDQLRPDDRVALVVYGTRGRVVLAPTGDRGEIRRAIDRLVPEGSTNAEEGLRLAYELAERERRRGAIHRVILCSDGVANVGRTSAESILGEIRRHASQGIELTTVGFGMGNYNDVLMERLADSGNGRYAYVDSLDEARRIFVENLTGTLQTIAAEARVQVEWNPETVTRYRLVGYENRDIADERFRDDTVDAGEIGAGHTVTALYEIKLHKRLKRRDRIATLHLRWGSIAGGEMVEISRQVTGADFAPSWEKASPALRLTSLVAELAEILKGTYWAREGDLDEVFRRAQKVSAEFAGDREVADFVSLVGRAASHRRQE